MGNFDPRVDDYIDAAAPFARPILIHLRAIIHDACPEVKETIKWAFPNFEYKGILCSFAAFKEHCSFGLWKSSLLDDPHGVLKDTGEAAMGNVGKIARLEDLPAAEILHDLIVQAADLNAKGIKVPATPKSSGPKVLEVPSYFEELLEQNEDARGNFESMPYSHKKEYVEWITEAKTEKTRAERLAKAMVMLAEGKSRYWNYKPK